MRIHGFHDGAACGQIRVLLPLAALRDLGGHTVTASWGWGPEPRNEEALAADLLIGQRLDRHDGIALWRRLAASHRLVYEIDDDIWTIDRSNWQARRLRSLSAHDAVEQGLAISHLVTASTAPLAEVVSKFNPNVVVLPNLIDGRVLDIDRSPNERLVVGWAGGSSHLPDLTMIARTLGRYLRQHPAVELHNVGSDFRQVLKIPGRYTDWNTDLDAYYRSLDFDIGLAPLAPIPFNRSKSGLKAIEYMARGIAVIASDQEPYRGVIEHGVTGFLASRPHEWMRYLRELTADAELRRRVGQAGKQAVRENWTVQDGWRRWEAAYESVLNRRAVPVGGTS